MAYRWRYCALKQERLQEPIVMCGLGRLYSKQSIIEQLLDKGTEMPDACKHIKSLRDVRDLQLTSNPIYNKDANKTEGMLDTRSAPYICKLIGLEMSGKFRFVALWSCGCVFSERALKEIGTKVCSLCQTPFTDEDVIILNGTDEEAEAMVTKLEVRIARRKSEKKSKKDSKKAAATATITSSASSADAMEIKTEPGVKLEESKPIVDMRIFKTEFVKERTTKSEDKAGPSNIGKFLPNSSIKRPATATVLDSTLKKVKENSAISVANDPKASEVYKSLFTSHGSAQTQERAHWVTYNPFYN